VLFLYSHNQSQASLADIWLPLGFTLVLATALMCLARLIFHDSRRAGMMVTFFLFLFYSYGRVCQALRDRWPARYILASLVVLALYTVLIVVVCILLRRHKGTYHSMTRLLNAAVVALLVVPAVRIAAHAWASDRAPVPLPSISLSSPPPPGGRAPQDLPDIYYIIMDRYASAGTLRDVYGYDNGEFTGYLRGRGFYVADSSTCNYARTDFSLASSLNLVYLTDLLEETRTPGRFMRAVYSWLQDHAVLRFLRQQGYRFVHFGSWWTPTSRNDRADLNVNRHILSEFSMVLYKTTMLYAVGAALGLDSHGEQWRRVPYEFQRLKGMPAVAGPKFVFVHFLVPHEGFVFDRDGRFVSRTEQARRALEENYVNQLVYTNRELTEAMESIITRSEKQPIVILQADEGPRPVANFTPRNSVGDLRARFGILNAYYLPGVDTSVLYPTITPVNSFRIVLNLYFDTNLELLPDRNFVLDSYDVREVTDVVARSTRGEAAPTGPAVH